MFHGWAVKRVPFGRREIIEKLERTRKGEKIPQPRKADGEKKPSYNSMTSGGKFEGTVSWAFSKKKKVKGLVRGKAASQIEKH